MRKIVAFFSMENLLILGSLFLLVSSGLAIQNASVLYRGVRTSGTITNVRPTSDEAEPFFQTTFAFRAKDGKFYTVTPKLIERPPPYKPGDRVVIVYEAGKPYDASIASWKEMWDIPVYFGTIGAVMLIVGLVVWKRSRTKPLKQ